MPTPKDSRVGPFEYMKQLLSSEQLPDMYAQQWPELQQKLATVSQEMPNEAAKLRRVRPMSLLERTFYPDVYGKTTPFGNIMLNKELMQSEGVDVGDTLVHELTHIGQGKGGFLKKYIGGGANKLEDEAVNREALRPIRRNDINLPAARKR